MSRLCSNAASAARDRADEAVMSTAQTSGFFVARGFPADIPLDPDSRMELLRVFRLPERRSERYGGKSSMRRI